MKKIIILISVLLVALALFSALTLSNTENHSTTSEFQICNSYNPDIGCTTYKLKTLWEKLPLGFRKITYHVLDASGSPINNYDIEVKHYTFLKVLQSFQEGYYDNGTFVATSEPSVEASKGNINLNISNNSGNYTFTKIIFWPNPQTFIYELIVSSNGTKKQKKST